MSTSTAYKRARFATRLPNELLYTPGHYWLRRLPEADCWQVGLTKFATRMLGDMVEFDLEVKPGEAISVGQVVGWLEGFKATTDLFAVVTGTMGERNDALDGTEYLTADPYHRGWMFSVRGTPLHTIDVAGYAAVLDREIDKILAAE